MPNECYNNIIITCPDTIELQNLYNRELIKTEDEAKNEQLYYYKNIIIGKKTNNFIKFRQITKWNPDYEWLERLLIDYPNCWIKNEWYDEDVTEGIWIGNTNKENIITAQWQIPIEVYKNMYY